MEWIVGAISRFRDWLFRPSVNNNINNNVNNNNVVTVRPLLVLDTRELYTQPIQNPAKKIIVVDDVAFRQETQKISGKNLTVGFVAAATARVKVECDDEDAECTFEIISGEDNGKGT